MLEVYTHVKGRVASKTGRPAFLTFAVGLLAVLAFACGGAQGVPSPTPAAEVGTLAPALTPTATPSPSAGTVAAPTALPPEASRIAYLSHNVDVQVPTVDIYVVQPDGQSLVAVAKGIDIPWDGPHWSPAGDELALCAFSGELQVLGIENPVPRTLYDGRCFGVTWAPDGRRIAFYAPFHMGLSDVWVVDRDGTGLRNLTESGRGFYVGASWSPDSSQIAFVSDPEFGTGGGEWPDLYVVDVESGQMTQLTNDPSRETEPAWSPDGAWIAFGKGQTISMINVESRETRTIVDEGFRPEWSPDGSKLAFIGSAGLAEDALNDLYVIARDGTSRKKLNQAPDVIHLFSWSPDGQQIAFDFAPDWSGPTKIYVVNADGSNLRPLTDGENEYGPMWSPRLPMPPVPTSTSTSGPTTTAGATPTTAPMVDARSVPVESLLRPGAKVKKVLYASLDGTPPEEIVVYSEITILKDERECGPVPFLEVFAYDSGRDQWGKVFDASEGEGPLAGIRLEDYEQGPMCFGYWIHPLELTDLDGDGRHELLARFFLGTGGTANFTDVTVLGFEGEAPEFTATKLFEAHLWKLQAVVVASERELWLDQGLWLRGGGAQMPAMLRGVVRHDPASGTIAVVDEEERLLCMEGTVLDKAPDTLTIRCEADEPGVRESVPPEFEGEERFPVDVQFIVDRYTQFEPKSSVNSLDDVQIGQSVLVWPATLGLQAVRGVTWGWRVEDGVWDGSGAWVSPVAGIVEVLSAP